MSGSQTSYGSYDGRVFIDGFNSGGVVHNDSEGYLTTRKIVTVDISDNVITSEKLANDISYNGILTVVDCSGGSFNQVANKGYVDDQITEIRDGIPQETVDTLKELSDKLVDENGNELYARLASPTFTGTVTVSDNITVSDFSTGVVHSDASGNLSSSLIVNGDISNNTLTSIKFAKNSDISGNTAFGTNTFSALTTGSYNTATGFNSLQANTTGIYNTATGYNSLQDNNTGNGNTAYGFQSLINNKVGGLNTATGISALYNNNSGNYNTATGNSALSNNTTGSNNTAIGHQAGKNNKTNNNNTFLGTFSDLDSSANAWANSTAIGHNSKITASNQIVLGTSTETVNIPKLNSLGVVKSDPSGNLTSSLILNSDISNNTLTSIKFAKNSNTSLNTAFGTNTFSALTTGSNNTAIGFSALQNNTTGSSNTATGYNSLQSNTTGNNNMAYGHQSLKNNTIGSNNIAIGFYALNSDISGNSNTAIGFQSLQYDVSGNGNTAIGYNSLRQNLTSNNTAIGYQSLQANTTGSYNTATGYNSLQANTTGNSNTATGLQALENNTTGYNNTATGYKSLQNNTYGYGNTAYGLWTLINNTNGDNNTSIGLFALQYNTTGNYNTAIGHQAGKNNKTNNYNTFLGSLSDLDSSANAWANSTAIGYNSKITASNQIVIGTSNETINIPKMSNIGFVKTDASGNLTTTTSLESSVMPTSAPANQTQPPAGTFWFDVLNKKLKISDGSVWYDLTLTPST